MHAFIDEFRTAVRFLGRHRTATIVAILMMALAIGANTAVFSVLRAFLHAGLGVPETDRLMLIWTTREIADRGRVNFFDAYPNFRLMRDSTHSFSELAAVLQTDLAWRIGDETRRLGGAQVTASFFATVKARAAAGRFFSADEDGPGAPPVAVISHALWQREFGGAADAVGQSLQLNGVAHIIVGVAPAGFAQPTGTEIWLPFEIPEALRNAVVGARQLWIFGRLAPGVTRAQADAELAGFAVRAAEANPDNRDWSWRVQPVREALLDGAERAVWLVQGGALVLLLLAIANLAALQLSWTAELRRDTAVRLALGAPAARLRRQFLAQSSVLAVAGGVAGVALAAAAIPLIQRFNPNPVLTVFVQQVSLDVVALAVTAALVGGSVFAIGLLPAWQARAVQLLEVLRTESRSVSIGRGALRWQQTMVVVQAGVSVLILVGAALAALVLHRLTSVDLGFEVERRVVFRTQLHESAYGEHEDRAALLRRFEENLAGEPAVASFGATSTLPVGDLQWGGGFHPEQVDGSFAEQPIVAHYRRVSPGYAATLGLRLLEGRWLTSDDRADTPPVALVSETFARTYWPGDRAVGRRLLRSAGRDAPPVDVVGVVSDVRDAGAGVAAGETVYIPFDQISSRRVSILLLPRGATADALAAAKRALRAADPELAVADVATLVDLAHQANAVPRLQAALLGVFAAIAAGIAALGSYGAMNQIVLVRRRELAIRHALGATPRRLRGSVLWLNGRLVASGIVAGVAGAWLLAGWAGEDVRGFTNLPVWPYLAVSLGMLAVTQLASWLPATRAARAGVREVLSG